MNKEIANILEQYLAQTDDSLLNRKSYDLESFSRLSVFLTTSTTDRYDYDVALKENLLNGLTDKEPREKIFWICAICDLCLYLADQYLADESSAAMMLEDALDLLTIAECQQLFTYMESRVTTLTKNMVPNRGKALVFLRLCNELLRRLSKTKNTSFCGRILQFIANIYPMSDRSGVNLRGELNTENVTRYEGYLETHDWKEIVKNGLEVGTTDLLQYSISREFYLILWHLQDFFNCPTKCIDDLELRKLFENMMTVVLRVFDMYNTQDQQGKHGPTISSSNDFFAKYLSLYSLLPLELKDDHFRRNILTQALIMVHYIQQKVKMTTETAPKVFDELDSKIIATMNATGDLGSSWSTFLQDSMEMENFWLKWKAQSCPSFEKPSTGAINGQQQSDPAPSFLFGNKELHRLWRLKKDIDDDSISAVKPSLKEFLAPLKEQLNPEDCIEKQYRLSKDEIYCWRALRVVAQENVNMFQKITDFDIEHLIPETFAEEKK